MLSFLSHHEAFDELADRSPGDRVVLLLRNAGGAVFGYTVTVGRKYNLGGAVELQDDADEPFVLNRLGPGHCSDGVTLLGHIEAY